MQIETEELLADNEEGQQRLREAVERKEHWLAGEVENEDNKNRVDEDWSPRRHGGGGKAAMATDEVENIEHAETSARGAMLGEGDWNIEREVDRSLPNSPAKYDIGTPGRIIEMEDSIAIEDGPARALDL